MITGAKSYLKKATPKYKELAQLVIKQLRTLDGAPQEPIEEEVIETKAKQKGGFGGRQGGKDAWGNLLTSRGHMVNKVMTKEPQTLEQIVQATGLPRGVVQTHLRWMAKNRGHVVESEEGWRAK